MSAACSLGNAVGPFVGGGFATAGLWRWLFRVIAILGAIVAVVVHVIVPLKPVQGSVVEKLKMIDYVGILLSSAATIFLLIPISGGGTTFPWSSATTIALLVTGVVCLVAFVVAEAKIAKLPILPCKLSSRSVWAQQPLMTNQRPVRLFRMWTPTVVMVLSFLIGMMYYGVSNSLEAVQPRSNV